MDSVLQAECEERADFAQLDEWQDEIELRSVAYLAFRSVEHCPPLAKVRIRLLLAPGLEYPGKIGSSMPDFSVAGDETPPWPAAALRSTMERKAQVSARSYALNFFLDMRNYRARFRRV